MATDYRARLKLPPEVIDQGAPDFLLFTPAGLLVATGFDRVVIGQRGPYLELRKDQLVHEALHWVRTGAYYVEYRSNDVANVKVYYQVWTVDYADYRIDFWYISPFDLVREDRSTLIDPLPRTRRRA